MSKEGLAPHPHPPSLPSRVANFMKKPKTVACQAAPNPSRTETNQNCFDNWLYQRKKPVNLGGEGECSKVKSI